MSEFFRKLKCVSIADIGHIFLFLAAIIPAACMRKTRKNLWLVCEYGLEARDNGYWFYKYVKEHHPKQDIVYAIDFSSEDYKRVAGLGECVPYGTFRHWIYYLCAQVNISSQKGGKPNAAVCNLLEVYGFLKNKRVFLQHGITKDDAELFYYKNTKMRLFICGAKPEYEFVKKRFGYPDGYVAYTGFARFDELPLKHEQESRLILVAPTWRRWLYQVSNNPYENEKSDIHTTQYYQSWMGFLKSEKLADLLEKYDYRIVFFPHRNMTASFNGLDKIADRVQCMTWKDADIQKLMMRADCMITDYSSTAMDFAYMKKPVIYYQFDYAKYRSEQFTEGYFDYERDGFGKVCAREEELLKELDGVLERNSRMEKTYERLCDAFFELRDHSNCERIYEQIRAIANGRSID